MRRVISTFVLTLAAATLGCANGDPGAGPGDALDFRVEVRNLPFRRSLLKENAPAQTVLCPTLSGTVRYGLIPHRLAGEPAKSVQNFVSFAAVYEGEAPPTIVIDLDRNGRLACEEAVATIAHPGEPGQYFRTATLTWNGSDGAPARSRRYRVTIPGRLESREQDLYALQMVDVPVALWKVEDQTAVLVMYDGNHNGIHDREFGDGLLVDPTGQGRFDLDPFEGDSFFSYAFPIELPWGLFEIQEVDRQGRFVRLAAMDDANAEAWKPFEVGDSVPALQCTATDGEPVDLGGPNRAYQLIYFWLSHCGSCKEDMAQLAPYLQELAPGLLRAVGVSLDEERVDFEDFIAANDLDWPQCFSGRMFWDHPVARRFHVDTPSQFVIIDRAGRFVATGIGIDDLRREVARLEVLTAGL